jgi:hypothetical protein
MIRHIFLWKTAPNADTNEVIRLLNELPTKIPGCRSWTIGKHQGAPGASGDLWDGGLVSDFDTFADLQRYSDHPFHMEIVNKLLPMFAARAVCDFELHDAVGGKQ